MSVRRGLFLGLLSLVTTPLGASAETGRVVLQFDDGNISHYQAADTLDAYGFPGSFGIVIGNTVANQPWSLSLAMVSDLHARGHEIHDHTVNHDAALWCSNPALWGVHCDSSLAVLARCGVFPMTGWNQPGGAGECFRAALRDTLLSRGYTYAAGRVGLASVQFRNFHRHLKDDPFSLGRGGVASWGYNCRLSPWSAAGELAAIERLVADGLAQGLVVIPLFHKTLETDSTLWALGHLCRWLKTVRDVQVLRMRDAVTWAQQEPPVGANLVADLLTDRNADGYLDGWALTGPVRPDSAVLALNGATTTGYGPHPLATALRFTFDARVTAPGDNVKVEVTSRAVVNPDGAYSTTVAVLTFFVSPSWQAFEANLPLAPNTDRVEVLFFGVNDSLYVRRARLDEVAPVGTGVGRPPRAGHVHALRVGPNPAGWLSDLHVLFTDARVVGAEGYDARGARVQLDRPVSAGVYFMRYRLADGCVIPKKVVIVR